MQTGFGSWLARAYKPHVAASRLANCRRAEEYYGNLDVAYGTAKMSLLLKSLAYTCDDERRGRPNPSRIPINGNLREGLATLRHAVSLYIQFCENKPRPGTATDAKGCRLNLAAFSAPNGIVNVLSGDEVLRSATRELGIDLVRLVAKCAIWADPEVVRARRKLHPHATVFPEFRRGKKGEQRGAVINGERIDDNTKANQAIKVAIFDSVKRCKNFYACHVWPETCYDVRYHTSLPNLVLLPSALASLSDHDQGVALALRYRAFELFGWHPEGAAQPGQPPHYPSHTDWAASVASRQIHLQSGFGS